MNTENKTILEKIKEDQLNARKVGDKVLSANLTFLLGQLTQKKDPKDEDAINLIRATTKSIKAAWEGKEIPSDVSYDIKVMEQYLPGCLSEQEIKDFLDTAKHNGETITKAFMGKLNQVAKKAGKLVDNQQASVILNSYL